MEVNPLIRKEGKTLKKVKEGTRRDEKGEHAPNQRDAVAHRAGPLRITWL